MRLKSFNLTVRGASHIKKNRECQDASRSYYNNDVAIAVVCDGHGGDDYVRSAVGAAFASEIAEKNILNFVNNVNREELQRHPDKLITTLEASIISDWNDAVSSHFAQNPFREDEIALLSEKAKNRYLTKRLINSAYGTTLIAAAVTSDFWFGIHIGDGKCVAVDPEGGFSQPIPWDDKCFLNATTSICDSDALKSFRHFYSTSIPSALFLGSDGIDDSFSNTEQLNNLYKTVLCSFATSDFNSAVNDLKDYLPRLSAKGSGDDLSVAAVLDLSRIGEIDFVKEFNSGNEKTDFGDSNRIEEEELKQETDIQIYYTADIALQPDIVLTNNETPPEDASDNRDVSSVKTLKNAKWFGKIVRILSWETGNEKK